MALEHWPSSLGAPQLIDFMVSGVLPVKRTEMESNRPRVFRVTKTIMRDAQVSFYFNSVQLGAFWGFFEGGGNAGANWFLMPLLVGNIWSDHRVRFKTLPTQISVKKGKFKVSFTLETDQQNIG